MEPLEVIKSMDIEKIRGAFVRPTFAVEQTDCIKQYKVSGHDIFDENVRPKKLIKKDTDTKDPDGNPVVQLTAVEVARVALPFQKLIVKRRVGFMLSTPVEAEVVFDKETDKEKALVKKVEQIQDDNKMNYRNKELARRLMSEMECAEIWYLVETGETKPKFALRMKVLSPDLGDVLYPLFDSTGDMIAFARGYKLNESGTEVEHFDIYTDEFEYKYASRNSTWGLEVLTDALGATITNPIPNVVKKIMIVYYSQPLPEWAEVGSMISRFETLMSNHADTNDYFGSPILAVTGKVQGFAAKGESGKILELAENAKANYLALSTPPESIKMELDNLEKFIYAMTQTPNITFDKLLSLGTLSGIALKLMFLDAHLAVRDKEEIFGLGLQRRLNIIKAAIGNVIDTSLSVEAKTVQLHPVITPYLPANTTELIDNLTVSVTGGIMSKETAVEQNPLVPDAIIEMDRLKTDTTNQIAGL